MNLLQKTVAVAGVVTIIAMIIFPPVAWDRGGRGVEFHGYDFILNVADTGLKVYIELLLAQWLGVLICGGILYKVAGPSNPRKAVK